MERVRTSVFLVVFTKSMGLMQRFIKLLSPVAQASFLWFTEELGARG